MRNLVLIALIILTTGCSGRLMYVKYGVDPMTPSDRIEVTKVLNGFANGRRHSWTNMNSGYQYTMTPVNRYFIEDERECRKFTIDAVWPIRSPHRRHKQTSQRACTNYDQEWVLHECETLGECWFK